MRKLSLEAIIVLIGIMSCQSNSSTSVQTARITQPKTVTNSTTSTKRNVSPVEDPEFTIESIPYKNADAPLVDLVKQYEKENPQVQTQPVLYVKKAERTLTLYLCNINNRNNKNKIEDPPHDSRCRDLKEYPVSLGHHPRGDKQCEGDRKTPEGVFYITTIQYVGQSKFHAAMSISYPSPKHAQESRNCYGYNKDGSYHRRVLTSAQSRQIERAYQTCSKPAGNTPLGGGIQIHGSGGDPSDDWTWGCISPSSDAIDELLDPKLKLVQRGCSFKDGVRTEKTKVIIVP